VSEPRASNTICHKPYTIHHTRVVTSSFHSPLLNYPTALLGAVAVSYIKCKNVTYESSRKETFMDIQVDVSGCKDLSSSLSKYIEKETLDGENQYDASDGGFGKQDAEKGIIFEKFPPVLNVHLKRFEFNLEKMAMVKVNDKFEFPLVLEMAQFLKGEWGHERSGAKRSSKPLPRRCVLLLRSASFRCSPFRFAQCRCLEDVWPLATRPTLSTNSSARHRSNPRPGVPPPQRAAALWRRELWALLRVHPPRGY